MSNWRVATLSLLAAIVGLLAAAMPPTAQAQRPPIEPCDDCWWVGPGAASLTHAQADVTVADGRYRTRWTLTFENPGGGLAEGRVIVPLPANSVVTGLTLAGGPETLEGRLLGAGDAQRIYEEIVARIIDPALLRSLDDDLYEIRAFPVPAGETRFVLYTVTTPLAAESGEVVVEAPWSRMSPRPAAATLNTTIDVPWEVRTVIAPGHVPTIEREGPGTLDVSWQSPADWTAARDFRLHLGGGDGLVAARLLAHRASDEDGYFALLLAPSIEAGERVARDVVIVVDRSGSMYGEKIIQARAAAVRILDDLGTEDRFGIVSFADNATTFADALRPTSAADEAGTWIASIVDEGGTNIAAALRRAMDLLSGDRPATVVFLTDGLPTVGIEDTDGIINVAVGAAPTNVQLFTFGVGNDVDTKLLDALASRFTGSSHYVTPDERIDTEVGKLSERISTPVLLATSITFELPNGAAEPTVSALAPAAPGGIFVGEQLLIAGRYEGSGDVTAVLTGQTAEGAQRFEYELSLPETSDDPGIALLWAQRRIADLLRELRIEGAREGLIETVIGIANQFGIVTPYTSYLAAEPHVAFEEEEAMDAMDDAMADDSVGESAVRAAEAVSEIGAGEVEHSTPSAARLVGTRTYYRIGETWIEEGFDRSGPEPAEVMLDATKLAELQASDPQLVAASALGTRVIALGSSGWVLLMWPDPTADDSGTGTATPVLGERTGMKPAQTVDGSYVVQSGDTLWRIAAACYGEGRRWPEIWDANRDRVMDDGRTFSNANLIRIGWTLTIPGGCEGGS
ncbi:MAG: VWA domain-containing protein [Chloroflexota bacterium]|nr:VWA domain-containing protein [Chloroflexota bacterium]